MSASFPSFAHPPVVETVLGLQFVPLPKLTAGHFGWFWKDGLDATEWPITADASPLQQQTEVFGEFAAWTQPVVGVWPVLASPRLQIMNRTGDRMIQLQSNRFHYNWKKRDSDYPRYAVVRSEFERYYTLFKDFVQETGSGEIVPTQWELTYVDFFSNQSLGTGPRELQRIFPGLFGTQATPEDVHLETFAGEWHYEIVPRRGRLHVAASIGRIESESTVPGLITQMTARGAIDQPTMADVLAGLDVGHEAIVGTFLRLTSGAAHDSWNKNP